MDKSLYRLSHISDVHLGPLPKVRKRELLSKRVTGYINWKRHRGKTMGKLDGGKRDQIDVLETLIDDMLVQDVDHTAITGDLVNIATDAEIAQVKLWLDAHFDPAKTSLVPGNHDAYVPGSLAKTCAAWAPFYQFDGGIGPQYFPTLLRDQFVSIIGVSSARATMPFSAEGFFRKKQAERLEALLDQEKGRCRVVSIHHPPIHKAAPTHKRLRGIDRFQSVIRNAGAELILHGHTHLPTLNWIETRNGRVPVCGVASASQGAGGRRPMSNYSLFDITPKDTGFAIQMERRGFELDSKTIHHLESHDLSL